MLREALDSEGLGCHKAQALSEAPNYMGLTPVLWCEVASFMKRVSE